MVVLLIGELQSSHHKHLLRKHGIQGLLGKHELFSSLQRLLFDPKGLDQWCTPRAHDM